MDARIQLFGDDAQKLLPELRSWLAGEDELRGRISEENPVVESGQMGAITDVLLVALGAHGVGNALAASLSTWIQHHRPSVDIEVTGPNGRRTKISTRDADIADVKALILEVMED